MPPPRDVPNPGTEPRLPALQADSLQSKPPGEPKQLAFPFTRGSSRPGIELGSPALQADSLPAELPGKPFLIPYCPQITKIT